MKRTVRIGDSDFQVESDDTYLNSIDRAFEPAMVEVFRTFVKPDMVVLDIGGNIGLTALLFSRLAREVHVFEPSPTTHDILLRNLAMGNAENVVTYNLGLGTDAREALVTRSQNNRAGAFVSDTATRISGHVSESIKLDTLDAVCSRQGIDPDFIKIDVEGFEEAVLRGGAGVLARKKAVAVMELNHACLNILHRRTVPDYVDFLRSVFPHLYAVEADNTRVRNMHDESEAYSAMMSHVTHNHYPNLVGGFDDDIPHKLAALVARSRAASIKEVSGKVVITDAPGKAHPGTTLRIEVRVENSSGQDWQGTPRQPLNLAYHWLDGERNVVVFDGVRTPTPSSGFPSGSTLSVTMDVVAPEEPGTYLLQPSLVQEGSAWLEDHGLALDEVTVVVGEASRP
jgi:FkbM family methyltransferase